MSDANAATLLPQCVLLCVYMSTRLSRLPCRGAGYAVVVGIGLSFSVFVLGLTWIQVSLSPKQIGLDVDYDRINRHVPHQ